MLTQCNHVGTIRLAAAITASLFFGCALSIQAQQQPAPPSPQAPDPAEPSGVTIKKETKLVLVDAVVTDKKGNYVRDLAQNDFKVFEDNREQPISSYSSGAEAVTQPNGQRHYLILFFDNSTMAAPDQIQARGAAQKFIEANAGPESLMAVVDFGGSLRIVQNFTASSLLLRAAVSGIKTSAVDPNAPPPDVTVASTVVPTIGMSSLSNAAADFGARTMLLAIRSLAKNLRTIPARKMLILFSGGFPLSNENQSELTATIDACNKSNVAIYAVDLRGLLATAPGGSSWNRTTPGKTRSLAVSSNNLAHQSSIAPPRLVLAAYPVMGMPDPQHGGGGGGGTGGGGTGGGGRGGGGTGGGGTGGGGRGGGGTGGGGTGGGGRGGGGTGGGGTGGGGRGGGGTGGGGGRGGSGGSGGGSGGGTRGGSGGGGMPDSNHYKSNYSQPRSIIPQLPPSAATNQQVLAALADGTGGF